MKSINPVENGRASSLAGRVALVTGASGGIGRAMVTALHEEGVTVVAASRKPGMQASDFGDPRLGRLGVLTADMADLDSVPGLVDEVLRAHGRLDLLLPNAGTADVRSLDEVSREDWQRSLDVNLTAPFLLAQVAAPVMVKQGWGRILFTSSAAAYVGGFVGPHYAAAKAGLHGLVHYLSSRLAPHGVTANALAPRSLPTPGWSRSCPLEHRCRPSVDSGPPGRLLTWGWPSCATDTSQARSSLSTEVSTPPELSIPPQVPAPSLRHEGLTFRGRTRARAVSKSWLGRLTEGSSRDLVTKNAGNTDTVTDHTLYRARPNWSAAGGVDANLLLLKGGRMQ